MSKPRKFSKKNCVDNDSRFYKSEFDHLFKRDLINKRVYLYFQIIENARKMGDPYLGRGISRSDLCLALYQNIKIIDFFASNSENFKSSSLVEVDKLVEKWLKEKYIIWWLLTCEAVDDLKAEGTISEDEDGRYLFINKKD